MCMPSLDLAIMPGNDYGSGACLALIKSLLVLVLALALSTVANSLIPCAVQLIAVDVVSKCKSRLPLAT